MTTTDRELSDAQLAAACGLSTASIRSYRSALRAQWKRFATPRGLPSWFDEPGDVAMTLEQITSLVAAGGSGDLRGPGDDAGPLPPASLAVLLSALRWAHRRNGLIWVGDSERSLLAELRNSYGRMYSAPQMVARPLTAADLSCLFDQIPAMRNLRSIAVGAAKSLSVRAGIPLRAVATLVPSGVRSLDGEDATRVSVPGHAPLTLPCTAVGASDPAVAAACVHCLLTRWVELAEPGTRLLSSTALHHLRRDLPDFVDTLSGARLSGDVLTATDEPTRRALIWTADVVRWMRVRAAVLPAVLTGLSVRDLGELRLLDTQIDPSTARLAADRGRTLRATGGPLCPVNGLASYGAWARAFFPDREFFYVSCEGFSLAHAQVCPHPGRTLHDSTAQWLKAHSPEGASLPTGARTTLTVQSTRAGFQELAAARGAGLAQISRALGHVREETTERALRRIGVMDDLPIATILDRLTGSDE